MYCVIVDGYSSGNLLPGEFKKRGCDALHVSSTADIWPILSLTYRPDDYRQHFAFRETLAPLVEELRPFQPVCVLPGTETGVELADALSEALGVPSNGTRLSEARRNKYLMIEAIRRHGLRAAQQLQSDNVDEVLRWAQSFPRVVVKPVKSAGTDSVAICQSEAEIRQACEIILGKPNMLGLLNEVVLAQEFLSGTEYALDAVTCRGTTQFTAIWRYYKLFANGRDFVYDRDELVSCTDETGQQLCDYVREVLTALEVTHGPSHAEVMMTADGPCLVEIGTRLNGTTVPSLHQKCVGYGQLDLTVDACLDPPAFVEKARHPYQLKQHAVAMALIADRSGIVKSVPGQAAIEQLPSFSEAYWRAKPGYRMRPTVDYYTNPAFIMLVHPDPSVLEADRTRIREMERQGLYELEDA